MTVDEPGGALYKRHRVQDVCQSAGMTFVAHLCNLYQPSPLGMQSVPITKVEKMPSKIILTIDKLLSVHLNLSPFRVQVFTTSLHRKCHFHYF